MVVIHKMDNDNNSKKQFQVIRAQSNAKTQLRWQNCPQRKPSTHIMTCCLLKKTWLLEPFLHAQSTVEHTFALVSWGPNFHPDVGPTQRGGALERESLSTPGDHADLNHGKRKHNDRPCAFQKQCEVFKPLQESCEECDQLEGFWRGCFTSLAHHPSMEPERFASQTKFLGSMFALRVPGFPLPRPDSAKQAPNWAKARKRGGRTRCSVSLGPVATLLLLARFGSFWTSDYLGKLFWVKLRLVRPMHSKVLESGLRGPVEQETRRKAKGSPFRGVQMFGHVPIELSKKCLVLFSLGNPLHVLDPMKGTGRICSYSHILTLGCWESMASPICLGMPLQTDT